MGEIKLRTERNERVLVTTLTRKMADNPNIDVDTSVYLSEKRTGNKNRALAYLLKTTFNVEYPLLAANVIALLITGGVTALLLVTLLKKGKEKEKDSDRGPSLGPQIEARLPWGH